MIGFAKSNARKSNDWLKAALFAGFSTLRN